MVHEEKEEEEEEEDGEFEDNQMVGKGVVV